MCRGPRRSSAEASREDLLLPLQYLRRACWSSSKPGGDTGEEEEGLLGWLLRKIGEVLGTIGDGILGLLQATLGKILDGIIELVTMAFDKLTQLVDLFVSFGDALGVLWT